MSERLPWFAALWVVFTVAWTIVQLAVGRLAPLGAAVYLAVVGLVLGVLLLSCGKHPSGRRVPWMILAACLTLAAASAAAIVHTGGFVEAIAFSLCLLSFASSLWLAWGGRMAAVLAVGTFGIWLAVRPLLASFVNPAELAVGFGVAVAMTIALADAVERSFRGLWEQRQAERLVNRDLALARDAYREAYERIQQHEIQLRRLARRQSTVREDERKRLGLDLHDGVCQEIVGVGIHVEALQARLAARDAEAAGELGRIAEHLRELNDHLRALAHDLRPMVLLDLGLEESLRSLAAGLAVPATAVIADIVTPLPALAEPTAMGVYRIAQEALTNAVRHASARTVVLRLWVRGQVLHLEITDDGQGFDVAACRHGETIGLVSMEERARALGGGLDIHVTPGRGTTVLLAVPAALGARASAA